MKTPFRPWPEVPSLVVALWCLVAFSLLGPASLQAISLTGSNGRAVEFHRIKTATPKGITAQMVEDGPVIGITWDKLDLKALEQNQKLIYAAYLRAIEGETINLELGPGMEGGGSEPATPSEGTAEAVKPAPPKYPGWLDTSIGKMTFMLQLPMGKPRGVLIVSLGDYGRSFNYLSAHQRGSGAWSEFQNQYDLALMTYSLPEAERNVDPTVPMEFVFAGKGSGKTFESAINDFAIKAEIPDLIDVPIALYGADRSGAAFVYNFVQYRPERILAAVVGKGAFYDAEPTAESAKVPMLFIWGQYCNNHEIWNSPNHAVSVLAKAAPLNPAWTSGREYRGRGEPNPVVEHFGRKYLLEMVEARLPEKKEEPPAPAEGEGDDKADGKEEKPEEEPEVPAEEEKGPVVLELDRSTGFVGNILTGETVKITDPDAALGEDETYIPNGNVARLWKSFVLGEMEAPLPGAPLQ